MTKYTGYDSTGVELFVEESSNLPRLLALKDPSEEGGLGRTFEQIVRDNDGYIEDHNTVVVFDSQDDDRP
jgi:hypothetical protein